MAQPRSNVSRRGSKNTTEKDDDDTENNGYIQILVKPLEQGSYSYLLKWFGVNKGSLSAQQLGVCYGFTAVASSVLLYQLLRCDVGFLFQRLCSLIVPMFSILCAFYWLSLYFRRTWSNTSIYLLFCSCYMGEGFAQMLLRDWGEDNTESTEGYNVEATSDLSTSALLSNYTTQPLVIVCVLLFISIASVFSSLETSHSAGVIVLVSFTRFLACSALQDVPFGLRPFVAYSCAFAGNIVAKYMEAVLKPQIQNLTTQDGKIPVIKRRRSSSSAAHAFSAHRSARRTSLPALIQKSQSSSTGYESAIIGEAHGLITDMLADSSLPPHIVSGLRAVSNLLKPPDAQGSFHKPRVSPLVSLSENTNYGSDSEESPYTGERPSTLPKRLRRSLPPSLIRRMSTSTWTTTTSATGMPTLEPEPCRLRSSSFRHSREGTPGSSPNGSRSNSPSPPSNSTTVLTIPKSRSFSLASASATQTPYQRRFSSRKSTASESAVNAYDSSPTKLESRPIVNPLARSGEPVEAEETSPVKLTKDVSNSALIQKRFITSDYDSSDSPNSSDHSDNVGTAEDVTGSPPRKDVLRLASTSVCKVKENIRRHDEEEDDKEREDNGDEDDEEVECVDNEKRKSSSRKLSPVCAEMTASESSKLGLLFDPEKELEKSPLLHISRLNEWDYPIFEVAEAEGTMLLTKVAYKLFTEVGLMETFRIPLPEFLNYFHDLELGYRNKPYHNCVHATDVLHGVYYLTTQPIPGFTQIQTGDGLSRHGFSSESDSDTTERSHRAHRASFMAEDSYGIMGGNFPALELMALYTAAAMHDYDHPGRTNAFLVATTAPQAVLYNDRSVLENHHAASAWSLLLNKRKNYFISGLEAAEFKRFRFLVIEAILATDLKRHFEILAEFNAKVNDEEAPGIEWTQETDRLLVTQMVIKLADINGPAKQQDLHQQWTFRIAEEFYEQGDEEASLGLPISPYMDRRNSQLAKLQETFINHLVAPLCNAMVTGGLLPGTWVEESPEEVAERETQQNCPGRDTEDEDNDTDNESGMGDVKQHKPTPRKVNCQLTKNMKDNYEYWIGILKMEEEEQKKALAESEASCTIRDQVAEKTEMDTINEESESPPMSARVPSTPPFNAMSLTPSANSAFQSITSLSTPVMDDDRSTAV